MTEQYNRGITGERLAVVYLISKGYRILAQNFRYLKAEVDIIALKGQLFGGGGGKNTIFNSIWCS